MPDQAGCCGYRRAFHSGGEGTGGGGGIFEKIYGGARQAGIKKVILPAENVKDVPPGITGIEVVSVSDVVDTFKHVLRGGRNLWRIA